MNLLVIGLIASITNAESQTKKPIPGFGSLIGSKYPLNGKNIGCCLDTIKKLEIRMMPASDAMQACLYRWEVAYFTAAKSRTFENQDKGAIVTVNSPKGPSANASSP